MGLGQGSLSRGRGGKAGVGERVSGGVVSRVRSQVTPGHILTPRFAQAYSS